MNFGEQPLFCTVDLGNGHLWHVKSRYVNLVARAGGSYGCVCEADDLVTQKKVAIKRLRQPFTDQTKAKYCYREIKLLSHLRGDDRNSLLELYDVFTPQTSPDSLEDVYIVTELAEITLQNMLTRPPEELAGEHIEFFLYRLMIGVKYLHECGVIHR